MDVTCDLLLEEALFHHIEPDRPLFPRLLKRLKILLENTAALLGKSTIDLETYALVYPLVSKVFRRSLTSENDATLAQFAQLGKELKDAIASGYQPFKVPKIQDTLTCSKASAYRLKEKWDSLGWIQHSAYATYALTPKGIEVLKGASSDNSGLPEILPPVEKLATTMRTLAASKGIQAVFSDLKTSNNKYSSSSILNFSQVFSQFSQASRKGETLSKKDFEVVNMDGFSQVRETQTELNNKNISESSFPVPTSDILEKSFLTDSFNSENLKKPGEKTSEDLAITITSNDNHSEKTLRKAEEFLKDSQHTTPILSEALALQKTTGAKSASVGSQAPATIIASPQIPQQVTTALTPQLPQPNVPTSDTDAECFARENLQDILVSLNRCESHDDLAYLYQIWDQSLIKAACELLVPETLRN